MSIKSEILISKVNARSTLAGFGRLQKNVLTFQLLLPKLRFFNSGVCFINLTAA